MGYQGAMDIDLPTEFGPAEETVEALMEYLVGPLLPLKYNISKDTPTESQQKSVAKQVHAVAVLYNYYHLNQNRESQFLKFDQFCNMAILLKQSILKYMKYMTQSGQPVLTDPENQLSITEKAVMDACTISETLLEASDNFSSMIKEWPVTKVAVLLVDSQKENCFLQFNDGVWSVIEKDIVAKDSEGKMGKKRLRKYDEKGEIGFQSIAFSAVKEVTGIGFDKIKVLESHLVYSLSRAKTATRFYILQSHQPINEDNLVPIQDAISSLQGPVVNKCSGSWVVTPVVEYYYLLPYSDIISKCFSRVSDSLSNQVNASINESSKKSKLEVKSKSEVESKLEDKLKLESGSVHSSYSSKEQPCDNLATKNSFNSNQNSEPISKMQNDVVTSRLTKSPVDQKVKDSENVISNKITTANNNHNIKPNLMNGSGKDESNSSQSISKMQDDVVTSRLTQSPVDQKVRDSENVITNKITTANNNHNIKPNIMNGFGKDESNSSQSISKMQDDVVTSRLTKSPVDQKVKDCENSISNKITTANNNHNIKPNIMNGFSKDESNSSSSGTNVKSSDKPLKVYHHEKRKVSNSKKGFPKIKSTVGQMKDDDEKKGCLVLTNEVKTLTVDHVLEDFQIMVDAKRPELSEAALRALLNKRQKLYVQQCNIEGELTLCDKKIEAIRNGGIGYNLGLKLDAVIDCCNESCKQDDEKVQEHKNLPVAKCLQLSGKNLSEAQLTLRKPCQELDDICLSNNWTLPTYRTTRSDGGFVANITVKGTNFECSGVSGIQPNINEARNSAATHVITKLQQMGNEHNIALL